MSVTRYFTWEYYKLLDVLQLPLVIIVTSLTCTQSLKGLLYLAGPAFKMEEVLDSVTWGH